MRYGNTNYTFVIMLILTFSGKYTYYRNDIFIIEERPVKNVM